MSWTYQGQASKHQHNILGVKHMGLFASKYEQMQQGVLLE